MFANFFGIAIIATSVLLIAGLVLRSPPEDLPATMNLGLVDKITVNTTITSAQSPESETKPKTPSQEYLSIKQRAVDKSISAPAQTNKSDK